MKRYILLLLVGVLSISCNSQNQKTEENKILAQENQKSEQPEGSWKVNKEFDENGNLIRYDSVYSWSSYDRYGDMDLEDRDSLIRSFESRFFQNFSQFQHQGYSDFFARDSMLSERFFNDSFFDSDFGREFMDIDHIMQQMLERQKQFLEKYDRREFTDPETKPETKKEDESEI